VSRSTYGKRQNQAEAMIGDACKVIVPYVEQSTKPRELDCTKKKQTLKEHSSAILSSFSYAYIQGNFKSRA
jgi:hypothetical protein